MTACALLTPHGRGAIATIAVRGPQARAIVGRVFRPRGALPLEVRAAGEIAVGEFRSEAAASEELVVGLVASDHLEIHCHGGAAATSAVLEALAREGCLVQTPAEWASGVEADPVRAEAFMALSRATTARSAGYLLDQYRGALSDALLQIRSFQAVGNDVAAAEAIQELLRWTEFGLHLTLPWRVVLAGQPNSGKSSLMNTILGYQRSIVFSQPGTTRDVLLATTAIDGWPMELRDMAGLRTTSDAIEAAGVERAWQEVAAADLVLFVSDITAPWDAALYQQVLSTVAPASPSRPASTSRLLIVHNKCDLAEAPIDARPNGQFVSAACGDGLGALLQAIVGTVLPEVPCRDSPIPFSVKQVESLRSLLKPGQSETP